MVSTSDSTPEAASRSIARIFCEDANLFVALNGSTVSVGSSRPRIDLNAAGDDGVVEERRTRIPDEAFK